jgi:hypothetical protein
MSSTPYIEVRLRIRPEEEYPVVERVAVTKGVHNLIWGDVVSAVQDGPPGISPKQYLDRVIRRINLYEPEASWKVLLFRGSQGWVMSYIQPDTIDEGLAIDPSEGVPRVVVERPSRFERILLDE